LKPHLSLITCFGIGHLRPAPGTWGSLPPIALAGVMLVIGHATGLAPTAVNPAWNPWAWLVYHGVLVATLLVFSGACIAQGDACEARYLCKDPSESVADEVAGQCIPLLFLPAAALSTPLLAAFTLLLAFFSFRLLDIFKPWPANRLQRVPAGWGILLDDLAAGLYALVIVQIAARLAL